MQKQLLFALFVVVVASALWVFVPQGAVFAAEPHTIYQPTCGKGEESVDGVCGKRVKASYCTANQDGFTPTGKNFTTCIPKKPGLFTKIVVGAGVVGKQVTGKVSKWSNEFQQGLKPNQAGKNIGCGMSGNTTCY